MRVCRCKFVIVHIRLCYRLGLCMSVCRSLQYPSHTQVVRSHGRLDNQQKTPSVSESPSSSLVPPGGRSFICIHSQHLQFARKNAWNILFGSGILF